MLEIFQNFISVLQGDIILTAIVPATNITVGPVDIIQEKQSELMKPQINLFQISEVQRSVPLNTRDTQVQLDIWSRNSQLEVENIYERVVTLLSYQIANQNTAHLFWDRLDGAVDHYESDRRIWHRACTFRVWSMK